MEKRSPPALLTGEARAATARNAHERPITPLGYTGKSSDLEAAAASWELTEVLGAAGGGQEPKTFTARAMTRITTAYEIRDSTAIRPLARRVNGIVSVGLTAIALVSDT
jgi:hypothetical protein